MAIGASGLIREKCKRHAIPGKRSLNWSPAARTNREQFLDKNGNPRYDCKNVGRAVPRRGGGHERRGDGTERKLRSAALNALTTFPRGQSARVRDRPRTRLSRRDRRFGREEGARKKFMSRDRGQPLDDVGFGEEKGRERKLLEGVLRPSRAFRKRS